MQGTARQALVGLRLLTAAMMFTHGTFRLVSGGVTPFGGFLDSQGLPAGVAIAWGITLMEIIGSLLLAGGIAIRPLALYFAAELTVGIVLVHSPEGWFVVGGGRNGMEYSVVLIGTLLAQAWAAPAFRRGRIPVALIVALSLATGTACSGAPEPTTDTLAVTPQAAIDELLAADRAFAAASATTDLVTGLAAMFADDIAQALPGGEWVQGEARAVEALLANPDNADARLEWTPVRGGISADGQHGFTFGYMTMTKADSSTVPLKYLAYWVNGPDGWRVVAYRRRPRPAGEVSLALMSPALPTQMVPLVTDSAVLAKHAASLAAAEQSFSDEAQVIGIGTAFAKYGSADAMNMGGPDDTTFVIGSERIGRNIGGTPPATGSAVTWNADRVMVASSGDLGVTFGIIREKTDSTGRYPFFTVWRRASPRDPWRYVAE